MEDMRHSCYPRQAHMCASYRTIFFKFLLQLYCQHAVTGWTHSVYLSFPAVYGKKSIDTNRRCRGPQSAVSDTGSFVVIARTCAAYVPHPTWMSEASTDRYGRCYPRLETAGNAQHLCALRHGGDFAGFQHACLEPTRTKLISYFESCLGQLWS